jgi:hypothetical protein
MVIYRDNPEGTHFINVDLDIHSSVSLQPLVSALGEKVMVLYVGRYKRTYSAHLEVTRVTKDADSTIRAFCHLIEALPKAERGLWDIAKVRDFNIGVQAETQPFSHEFAIAAETVKAVSKLGARIVFTVYAVYAPEVHETVAKAASKKAPGPTRKG